MSHLCMNSKNLSRKPPPYKKKQPAPLNPFQWTLLLGFPAREKQFHSWKGNSDNSLSRVLSSLYHLPPAGPTTSRLPDYLSVTSPALGPSRTLLIPSQPRDPTPPGHLLAASPAPSPPLLPVTSRAPPVPTSPRPLRARRAPPRCRRHHWPGGKSFSQLILRPRECGETS